MGGGTRQPPPVLCWGRGCRPFLSHAGTLLTSPGKELLLRGHLIPARFCDAQGMVKVKLNSERRTCALDDHTAQGGGRSVDLWPRQPPRVGGVSPDAGQTLRPDPHPQEARQDRTLVAQGTLGVGVGEVSG